MNRYIATFYSHFGAMAYRKALDGRGIAAKPMPVPRKISASCGTCVCYQSVSAIDLDGCELDRVYLADNDILNCVLEK